ncbi:DeoR/GlpR family transcriptional regulator of sugar metabolism [Neorhizobium huautlense]|uniref:DeoR/GlpR family transcriptional regulator of sugar metabolism n=1 Tax=Neorhizobium huautlense TaxID=67774 RepID=A0ABT9PZ92_9HYPH|nr:DeoR/GlpR family DNA-binding transcription regulator [Neorhizobium huautlense]MDP9839792.1 DeoR/GlpR family transcriptional regulator of sugar metabolism [Neorhizobium huautlense]
MENEANENHFTSAAQRQARLLGHLRSEMFADAQALKDALGVSIATVRRDLTELEARGLLKRMHGGAAIINQATRDHVVSVREEINAAEKARIGAAAAEMIVDGDAVIIDSGTTSLQAAKHLAGRASLTFITNGTDTLAQLVAGGQRDVHLIGGRYIEINRSLGGPMAVDAIRRFSVDKVILSVAAVDLKRGVIATTGLDISAVQAAMIEIAQTVIVVADNSKFDRSALSVIAPLSAIDHIVTDENTRPLTASLSSELQAKFIFV